MGKLDLGGVAVPDDMAPEAFIDALHAHLVEHYQAHFTLISETPQGRRPVGMVLAYWPDKRAPVLWIGHIAWFPWASARNRLEATVHFLNGMRGDWTILEFARAEDQPFFDHVSRYGVMRKAGTIFDLYAEPAAVYQTRKPYMRKAEWPSAQS